MLRLRSITLVWIALASAACTGSVDVPAGGDGDGDADADTDVDGPMTFTGRVVGESIGPHPALSGVEVELLGPSGEVVELDETDGAGVFELTAGEDDFTFIVAHAMGGYTGQLRAGGVRDGDEFYDITLQSDAGLDAVHEAVGLMVDRTRGTVVLGFNPADSAAGGEGGSLDPGSQDPPFVLVDDGAVSGARLPPICPRTGADPCVEGERGDFVFFPNVEPGPHRVTLVQPAGGTCAMRFPIDSWLVLPHTTTIIEVDCVAN